MRIGFKLAFHQTKTYTARAIKYLIRRGNEGKNKEKTIKFKSLPFFCKKFLNGNSENKNYILWYLIFFYTKYRFVAHSHDHPFFYPPKICVFVLMYF